MELGNFVYKVPSSDGLHTFLRIVAETYQWSVKYQHVEDTEYQI